MWKLGRLDWFVGGSNDECDGVVGASPEEKTAGPRAAGLKSKTARRPLVKWLLLLLLRMGAL